uniref:Reverse transcriptase domain-containing protein n=1 Tax=Scylla olivacea TaxID=85551 RepID=A0A0P4WKC4_SCYOL
MEKVLVGLQWKSTLVYLDDLLVFAGTFDQELERLEEELGRLQEANLKLSPKKCTFFQHEVPFLGHIVGEAVCTRTRQSVGSGGVVRPNVCGGRTKFPRPL